MLIDWFTVGAQALNFLVLVWLLKHFLYQPILDAIDAREQRIAAELTDADTKKSEALAERDRFREKNVAIDGQRADLLNKATDDANAERERLLKVARTDADTLSARRKKSLENEIRNLNEAIGQTAQREVFAVARKALRDLADASLEERMSHAFTRRLGELDATTRQRLIAASAPSNGVLLVRSAFDLPNAQREEIQGAVNDLLTGTTSLQFETAPEVVSGIELTINGLKVAWSIAGYLRELETGVNHLVNREKTATQASSVDASEDDASDDTNVEVPIEPMADAVESVHA